MRSMSRRVPEHQKRQSRLQRRNGKNISSLPGFRDRFDVGFQSVITRKKHAG